MSPDAQAVLPRCSAAHPASRLDLDGPLHDDLGQRHAETKEWDTDWRIGAELQKTRSQPAGSGLSFRWASSK
jgi:hypothetical protein